MLSAWEQHNYEELKWALKMEMKNSGLFLDLPDSVEIPSRFVLPQGTKVFEFRSMKGDTRASKLPLMQKKLIIIVYKLSDLWTGSSIQ